MTDQDINRISKVLDEKFKPLLGEVARIKNELRDSGMVQFKNNTELSRIGKDISRIDSSLETLDEDLKKNTKKLDILWDQVVKVTADLEQVKDNTEDVKKILVSRSDKSDDNIGKLNRLLF